MTKTSAPRQHWNFGDIEPVEGVTGRQAEAIVELDRWYQCADGLF